jgi:hypothetical protein
MLLPLAVTSVHTAQRAVTEISMNDEATQLLREIRDLQKQQIELLRAAVLPSWMRYRFSLRALLVFMTLVAVILGSLVALRTATTSAARSGVTTPRATPTQAFRR